MEKYDLWTSEYGKLGNGGRIGSKYSDEAYNIFPRYNILRAILNEVEKFTPADFSSIEQAKELLILSGQIADDIFTEKISSKIEGNAISEERDKFCSYIKYLTNEDLLRNTKLFYRRVLKDNEYKLLWSKFAAKWEIKGQYYYPLIEFKSTELLALSLDRFITDFGFEKLKQIFISKNFDKIFEFREYGASYEIELSIFEADYTGAEGYWTSEKMDWLIYTSHENSITFGGEWLIEEIKSNWNGWEKYLYE